MLNMVEATELESATRGLEPRVMPVSPRPQTKDWERVLAVFSFLRVFSIYFLVGRLFRFGAKIVSNYCL